MSDSLNKVNIENTSCDLQEQDETVSVELSESEFLNDFARTAAIERLKSDVSVASGTRELYRPKINSVRTALNIIIPLLVWAAVFCTLYFTLNDHRVVISVVVSLGLLALYIIVRMRALLIWCIKVYQRFAPDRVRLRCVFTPSCSEYAIAALQKYGVIRGIPKIISRLKRCHPPNEGEDFP